MAATPLPAATVLLVRDGPGGLEVFMVVRHRQIDFAGGAMVFPGGKVDAADTDPRLRPRCAGADGLSAEALALRVAAIREAFEEAGVLFARPRTESALLPAGQARLLGDRHRTALASGAITMAELVEREDLVLACDLLAPFAHWITPEFVPKRFDTHFFLAATPAGHGALHDGGESVDSAWLTPAAALADADAGRRTVILPTRMNLAKLGRHASVAAALEAAWSSPVVTVLPQVDMAAGVLRIPPEADYDLTEAPLTDLTGSSPGRGVRESGEPAPGRRR